MTDSPGDAAERNDPVLVRPYVNEAGEPPAALGEETWPDDAELPDAELPAAEPAGPEQSDPDRTNAEQSGAESPTAILPAGAAPPAPSHRGHPVHWALRLLALVAGVA